jgi:starch synthase (maltosyl-transferring)
MRLLLAATLGANYGVYGPAFELTEHRPVRSGSEEYLDSEKYQLRSWDLDRPDSLRDIIKLVNRIRNENAAFQNDWSLRFLDIDNENMLAYSKHSHDGSNLVIVVLSLHPNQQQWGSLTLPLNELGLDAEHPFQAHELLTDARYIWHGSKNMVGIDPASIPAQIFRVRKRLRTEREFEYFL